MPQEAQKRSRRADGATAFEGRAQDADVFAGDGDTVEGELAVSGIAYCPDMPDALQQSPDSGDVPPHIGKVRRGRVLVLAMLAALLGAVVLGRG